MVALVFVALKVGTVPETGFPFTSSKVMVIVELVVPSAVAAVPVIVEVDAETVPPVKTTDPPVTTTGDAIERTFVSA